MTTKPLLILECDDMATGLPEFHAARGDMAEFFIPLARPASCLVTRIWRGETPPDPERVSAAIITGSAAMVSDDEPWIDQARAWLRHAIGHGLPLLGVCFGHQLLADILGGQVAPTPDGPEYGSIGVALTPAGRRDPLTSGLPARFSAQSAHFQSVVRPPEGASILAESAAAIQALRYAPEIWGVQFHPEFTPEDVAMIVRGIAPRLSASGCDTAAIISSLEPSPAAASIIPRFAAILEKEPTA